MNTTRPIRLFADAHVFDGPFQGTRSFLHGLYTELAKEPRLELYLGARDCASLRRCFSDSPNIHFLPYRSNRSAGRLLFELPALLKTHRIDYAHFQYMAPPRKVCPYIVTTHDLLFEEMPSSFSAPYRGLRRGLFRRSARQADILTTVSGYAAASITARYGVPAEHLALVPNAVLPVPGNDGDRQQAKQRLRERYGVTRYLLCVSRLEPRKNQQLLVAAFQELGLAARGYQLVLIGTRSMPVPALDGALTRLDPNSRESVFLLHDIAEEELHDWYRAASLFIYPSLGEGFGIPPLEAAVAGLPVLCSNRTAMADFDFFGDDLLDPVATGAFTARIDALLKNPPTNEVLTQRAQTVLERYSWKRSASVFLQQIEAHYSKNSYR